jgi:hypothetical protein
MFLNLHFVLIWFLSVLQKICCRVIRVHSFIRQLSNDNPALRGLLEKMTLKNKLA